MFLDNLNKIKKAKKDQILGKQGLLARKFDGRDRDLMSQASYPTQVDGHEMDSYQDGQQREEYNSDSDFESLDPVYEDRESVDEDEVLLNVNPSKFEKPKDQLYMDFFVKYTQLFVDENQPSSRGLFGPKDLGSARGLKREQASGSSKNS